MAPSLPPELPPQLPVASVQPERTGLPQLVFSAVIALFLVVVAYFFLLGSDTSKTVPSREAHDLTDLTTPQNQAEPERQRNESNTSMETETSNTASAGQHASTSTGDKSESKSGANPPPIDSASAGSKTLSRVRDLTKQSEAEERRGNYGTAFERARDAWELVRAEPDDSERSVLTQKLEQELKRLGELANHQARTVAPRKPLKER